MKKITSHNGRRHGLRAKLTVEGRQKKTVLTCDSRGMSYCWSTTDRAFAKVVIKH